MSKYLDDTDNATTMLQIYAADLYDIAGSFRRIYNTELAEELEFIAGAIIKNADNISHAVGEKLMDDVNQSRSQFFGAMSSVIDKITEDK